MARRHLLSIGDLSRSEFDLLLNNAEALLEISSRQLKKVPALRGKTVINLFLQPSTRTRTSFEIAAKRLSADAVTILEGTSSLTEGETLLDTAMTLEAMAPDVLVVRHSQSGVPHLLAKHLADTSVVNAGDGDHEHPVQAILDCLTLKRRFGSNVSGLTLAIVGDVRHSRIARSTLKAHALLGNKIRLVGPPALVSKTFLGPELRDVEVHHDLEAGVEGADVVMCLRLSQQAKEQHIGGTYVRNFRVEEEVLRKAAPNSVVLHAGPVTRGVEITSEVVDGPRSLIRDQVRSGVAVGMSVLLSVITSSQAEVEQ